MCLRTIVSVWFIVAFPWIGIARSEVKESTIITDISCALKVEFNGYYTQCPTAIFAKVFTKHPGKFLKLVCWHEPLDQPSIFPFEPMGFAILINDSAITRYHLLSNGNWKAGVTVDEPGGVQFNVMEMPTIASLDSVLQNILSLDLADYSREELPGEIRLTHQHGGVVFWRHKISEIRCQFASDTGCLERADYYDTNNSFVCELKASKPAQLHDNRWVPTEIVMTIKEGQRLAYNSDLTISVYSEGYFKEKRAEGTVAYPPGGLVIHRDFEIFDNAVLLPSETKFYTGKHELIARSIFSNYRINTGIDDDVFDEQYLLAGAGISGVKGEWLRAKIALAHAQRAGKEASTYAHILPVVESVASADDAAMSIEARHLLIESLIEQKKYTEAIKSIMTLLEQVASTEGYGDLSAAASASGFATQFIKHGQMDLAQNILDKHVQYYVQYCTKEKQDLFQQALENFRSRYFHGIKFFEYISQHTADEAIKARCQFAIACCSDMIARESIDASTWYKTDAKKKEAVNQALRHYEAVIAKYPENRYAGWASHFSGFLATYPPKMGKPPQNTTAPPELIEQQAGKIMSDVRKILRSQRSQWGDALIDIYAKNVQAAYEGTLYRALTPAEYDHFRNSFSAYCERALPERLNNVDELAIELITIRWAVRQYVSRLDLASEQTETAVDRQVELIIEGFDQFVDTYLYDKRLESRISAGKKEFREAVDLYRRNILYPVFKVPLSPRELWRYERSILYQEKRMKGHLAISKTVAGMGPKREFNQLIISEKRDQIQSIIKIWVEAIGSAYNTIFPDEFHPDVPTKKRVIQYHYLPNKGIKLTFLVDKEDYPKLGLD